MSYESAPATVLLATNCACCARPLVDAKSVEAGMGPVCRDKHGFNIEVSPEARAEANKIVYGIAVEHSKTQPDAKKMIEDALKLKALGFDKLSSVIVDRTAQVKISEETGSLVVETPYNEAAVLAFRAVSGRRFDRDRKVNVVPVSSKQQLWDVLRRFFAGMPAVGPKGAFVVPSVA